MTPLLALVTLACAPTAAPPPAVAPVAAPAAAPAPAPPVAPLAVVTPPRPPATTPTLRWTELSNPCQQKGVPYAVHFRDPKTGWVGCGDGAGLWGTSDGGRSFTRAHPSLNLYVFDLADDAQGRLLVCGHDYAPSEGDVLLYRLGPAGWQAMLWFTNTPKDRGGVVMSNCGRVVALPDGTVVVASNTIGDLSWTQDDGRSWARAERYWEEANLTGGYGAHHIMDLHTYGGRLYGSGSTMHEPPLLYTPSQAPGARFYHMKKHVADPLTQGEAWASASPDGGRSWVVGGRDQRRSSEASGFLFFTPDAGQTWTPAQVDTPIDVVQDIAFSADGALGVAVGHRYPPASRGGFVLISTDGGRSWESQDVKTTPLQAVSVVGRDFWVSGDNTLGWGRWE